jgi:hypothetical protein
MLYTYFATEIPGLGMILFSGIFREISAAFTIFCRTLHNVVIIALFIIIERKTGMTKPSCGILLRDLLNRLS